MRRACTRATIRNFSREPWWSARWRRCSGSRRRPQSLSPMPQLVFIHGPGAGGCSDAYVHQRRHFPRSVAPDLPGHLEGLRCPDVARYAEWLRGWLWAQGLKNDLVLVGYTLGAAIALQYGLDHPEEVQGPVVRTVAARPKVRAAGTYEMRLKAP